MALEDELRRTNERLDEFIRQAGGSRSTGGSSGGSSGKAYTEAERAASSLANSLKEAKASFQNLQRTSKDYGTVSKLNNVAHNLFGKSTLEAHEHMNSLGDAIYQQQTLYRDAKKAGNEEVAGKARATLMNLQQQKANNEVNAQSASALGSSVGGFISIIANLENRLIGIEATYQAQLMSMVSQGQSGFSLFGASVEANIDKVTAASDAMADAASKAGSALSQMGGVILPIVGFALNIMAERAKAVSAANATLAKQGIRILVEEGNKLIKTHMEMTSTGLIFANGMQGLINATDGTKLRLEEMTAVVKENRASFAGMGMGMTEATELIGGVARKLASTTGKFANADRQLLALGYSYQEQAALAAETAEMMSRGGQKQGSNAVAQATMEMAKNMALVAEATGEDMKEKKKKMQAEQTEFAVKGAMAKLARDDPARHKQLIAQQLGMTDAQRKASNEMLVYGTVRDKDLAIQMALNSGLRKSVMENDAAFRNGTASTLQAGKTATKYAKETQDANIEMAGTVGKAAQAVGSFKGVASNAATDMDQNQRLANANFEKSQAKQDKLLDAAGKPTQAGDPTGALLDAIEVGATAAKEMQQKVVGVIGEIAAQLRAHYDSLKGAFDKRNYTGAGAGGSMPLSMEQILALMIALPIVRGLMMGGFTAAMNKVKTGSWLGKVAPAAPTAPATATTTATNTARTTSSAVDRAKELQAKNPGMSSKDALAEARRTGGFKQFAETEAKVAQNLAKSGTAINTVANEAGVLGKSMNFMKGGFQKLGPKIPIIGTALTVAMAGFSIAGIEARQAAGEISAEQARTEEGGVVGGAAGGVAGVLAGAAAGAAIGSVVPVIGTVIGGLIGGALGAWGGEALGSKLGESLMSHWGDITKWTSDMGKSIAENTSAAWATTKNWLATDGKQYWNMFTSGAKTVGKMALGVLETIPGVGVVIKGVQTAMSKAEEGFKSAYKTAGSFLTETGNKFKTTFPELTNMIQSMFGGIKSGLGSLMDGIRNSDTFKYIKDKVGLGDSPNSTTASPAGANNSTNKTTSAEKPATGPGTANLDGEYKKNADSWVAAVQGGKSFDSVPEMYKPYVKAQLAKGTPKNSKPTVATPTSAPGTAPAASTPAKSTPPTKVDAVGIPQKKDLTAQEKAAVYETIATNTKYTADLMQAQQRAMNSMLQQLAAITDATRETAYAAKKTAQNTN